MSKVYSVIGCISGPCVRTDITFRLKSFKSLEKATGYLLSAEPNHVRCLSFVDISDWEEVPAEGQSPLSSCCDTWRFFLAGGYPYSFMKDIDPEYAKVREYSLILYIEEMEVVE